MIRRVLLSVLGGLSAALGVLAATQHDPDWRTGVAAAIAFLAGVGVPSLHGELSPSAADQPPSPAPQAKTPTDAGSGAGGFGGSV